MRIRRSRLKGDFVTLPNSTVRDDRLSYMARGILAELISRPDGWEATADSLWQASKAKHGDASPGRRQFRAAFAELKEAGYLTSGREALGGGQYGTVLTLTDVPQAGTSVRPAETPETAGGTDVPHAGTPVDSTDVPHGGTPDSPAETGISAGRTDVPLSDVPPCGTSIEENGEKKTGLKTSSPTGRPANDDEDPFLVLAASSDSTPQQREAEDLKAFGDFWLLYPKKKAREEARRAWIAAIARGADPAHITEGAKRYAHERAGQDPQYTKYPATWLNKGCYDDEPDPAPTATFGGMPTAPNDLSHMTDEEIHRALQF